MVHIQSQLAYLYVCFSVSVVYQGSLVRDDMSLMLTKAAFISSKNTVKTVCCNILFKMY